VRLTGAIFATIGYSCAHRWAWNRGDYSCSANAAYRQDKDMVTNEVEKDTYWPPLCRGNTRTGRAVAARSGSFVNNDLKVRFILSPDCA